MVVCTYPRPPIVPVSTDMYRHRSPSADMCRHHSPFLVKDRLANQRTTATIPPQYQPLPVTSLQSARTIYKPDSKPPFPGEREKRRKRPCSPFPTHAFRDPNPSRSAESYQEEKTKKGKTESPSLPLRNPSHFREKKPSNT